MRAQGESVTGFSSFGAWLRVQETDSLRVQETARFAWANYRKTSSESSSESEENPGSPPIPDRINFAEGEDQLEHWRLEDLREAYKV